MSGARAIRVSFLVIRIIRRDGLCSAVVTGASEGIGRGYALEVWSFTSFVVFILVSYNVHNSG